MARRRKRKAPMDMIANPEALEDVGQAEGPEEIQTVIRTIVTCPGCGSQNLSNDGQRWQGGKPGEDGAREYGYYACRTCRKRFKVRIERR